MGSNTLKGYTLGTPTLWTLIIWILLRGTFCRIFLHQLVNAPEKVVKTLPDVLCSSRDGVPLGPKKDTCQQDSLLKLIALKKKFRTHVIKLDIAPMSFPPGQYLLVSASNNMLYYLSQWDKIRTTCVVNLMSQDTKFWLFKINCARIWTHNLQDNTLILYQCATFTLFKFVQIGYLNS